MTDPAAGDDPEAADTADGDPGQDPETIEYVFRVRFRLDPGRAGVRTDEHYQGALKDALADDLAAVNADSVSAALSKYLGSSIHVVD